MKVYQRRSRLAGNEAAPSKSTATDSRQSNGVAAWKRRHEAARRVVPLDCGCGPDPWVCRCTEPALTENQLDGWRRAALHVLAAGRTPLLPLEVRRALWRRPADRELAELLHDACGEIAS